MSKTRKTVALIVAAGRGSRAGTGGPKQYRMLGTKTVLQHTLEAFADHPAIDCVVVAIHQDDRDAYAAACPANPKLMTPVLGGETRQQSVCAGLKALGTAGCAKVLIHDAARPFVDPDLINRVVDGLEQNAAVLPALPIADTLKRATDGGRVIETISRASLHTAQTPQGFHFEAIFAAHNNAAHQGKSDFTDDSALAEWAGIDVTLVAGSPANIKLTSAADLAEADMRARHAIPDVRTGTGYDVHQLVRGDTITLCGVKIAHDKTLDGHSDADVGLHALTDAMLGCIAEGDIGTHFPPSDDRWKGASSDQFLAHAAKLVRERGGTITHCDVSLVCEAPKIVPHRDAMRSAIAAIVDIQIDRVSVKATTNERIGFVGREEGIAALASATSVFS